MGQQSGTEVTLLRELLYEYVSARSEAVRGRIAALLLDLAFGMVGRRAPLHDRGEVASDAVRWAVDPEALLRLAAVEAPEPRRYLIKPVAWAVAQYWGRQNRQPPVQATVVWDEERQAWTEYEAVSSELSALDVMLTVQQQECIRRCIESLAGADRELIRMVYVDGLSQKQVAERLALSHQAVRKRTSRARDSVRPCLADCRAS